MRKVAAGIAAVISGISVTTVALPHHSFAYFAIEKNTTYNGFVVSWAWENPHSHIVLRVPEDAADKATVGIWDIECQSVNIMSRQGWSKNSLRPGDHVQVIAHPMKDGSKGASLFFAILPDGSIHYGDIARPKVQ